MEIYKRFIKKEYDRLFNKHPDIGKVIPELKTYCYKNGKIVKYLGISKYIGIGTEPNEKWYEVKFKGIREPIILGEYNFKFK